MRNEAELVSMQTGQIEEWEFSGGMVWGRVYSDRKQRFPDGAYIHTSLVLECSTPTMEEGSIIETRNSIYRLGKKAQAQETGEVLDQQIAASTRGLQQGK